MSIALSQIQKQLDKFELGGILISKKIGTVRLYTFNPKLGVVKKIKELIEIFYEAIPLNEREKMFSNRRRPRRKNKEAIFILMPENASIKRC